MVTNTLITRRATVRWWFLTQLALISAAVGLIAYAAADTPVNVAKTHIASGSALFAFNSIVSIHDANGQLGLVLAGMSFI